MLAHSDVIAGRPGEAQPKELCSITAHYREERSTVCVCVCMCVSERMRICITCDAGEKKKKCSHSYLIESQLQFRDKKLVPAS